MQLYSSYEFSQSGNPIIAQWAKTGLDEYYLQKIDQEFKAIYPGGYNKADSAETLRALVEHFGVPGLIISSGGSTSEPL